MKKMTPTQLKITQIKSAIGYHISTKQTLKALGIRRMHMSVVQPDNPAIRGMIQSIPFLLKVEEIKE